MQSIDNIKTIILMMKIIEVKTKKEIKEFIDFPINLYKNNPYFVPPLYGDEKALFKKGSAQLRDCETVYYLAQLNGKTVGRISGILQKASNEKWNQKRVRFTRFDSIDDPKVASALFGAVENWAKEKGMDEIVGPLGFSDMEREGLLVDGFDYESTFEEQYNYPYYQTLIENLGYQKEVDWVERRVFLPEKIDERLERISKKMMERYSLRIATAKNTKEFLKKYADGFFEIVDSTYNDIYQSVPFTESMKKEMLAGFNLILNMEYIKVIVDKNDKIVCFGICFPAIGKALQKSGGKLTLPTIFKVLRAVKKPEVIDFGLIGVLPEYAGKGIASALIYEVMLLMKKYNVKYAETNLNLEDNYSVQNLWKNFETLQHKRRRSYVKKI
jgi:GNAT superfamily N-acetyltransferase